MCILFFFFKQKTAYEMRISDWSSDVCSSDLIIEIFRQQAAEAKPGRFQDGHRKAGMETARVPRQWTRHPVPARTVWGGHSRAVEIGRASCRERVCQSV